jgi:hypothetical protein
MLIYSDAASFLGSWLWVGVLARNDGGVRGCWLRIGQNFRHFIRASHWSGKESHNVLNKAHIGDGLIFYRILVTRVTTCVASDPREAVNMMLLE